ncbi:MAG TPA: NAD(P)H-hydrate epimerase [Bellilinea sp.]|nr:NAD(P)H-hydrate epimerase [Bellilinea sp.]
MDIPSLTRDQMKIVDQSMVQDYGISLVQMMENAGSHLADLAIQLLGDDYPLKKIVVLSGSGNNGGGGMVAARHLHNRGMKVKIGLAVKPDSLKDTPLAQWKILQKMEIPRAKWSDLMSAELIIDALIGYGLHGNPRGMVAEWIQGALISGVPVLALDTPSGLDVASGKPGEPTIRATATMTLALPKAGLLKESAKDFVGDLYLADISVPPQLYRQLGLPVELIFTDTPLIKI